MAKICFQVMDPNIFMPEARSPPPREFFFSTFSHPRPQSSSVITEWGRLYKGAPEKFVGGVGELSNYSINSWPWLAKIWLYKVLGSSRKVCRWVGRVGWVDFLIIVSAPGPG